MDRTEFMNKLNDVKDDKVLLEYLLAENTFADEPEEKLNVAEEECAELIKEISKQLRGKGDRAGLLEEIADVYICLFSLRRIFGFSEEAVRKAMMVKLQERVKGDSR